MKMFGFLLKNNKLTIDLFVGYRQEIGVVDLRAVEKFVKRKNIKDVILIANKPLTDGTEKYLKNYMSDINTEVIVTEKIQQEVKKIKQKNKGKVIKVVALDEFGERPMQNDSC